MRTMLLVIGALAVILLLALLLSRLLRTRSLTQSQERPERSSSGTTLAGACHGRYCRDDAGFNLLFAYISGSNKPREKIPMTAPVITSQKIPMTAPVVSDAGSMSFVMPAGTKREETPIRWTAGSGS